MKPRFTTHKWLSSIQDHEFLQANWRSRTSENSYDEIFLWCTRYNHIEYFADKTTAFGKEKSVLPPRKYKATNVCKRCNEINCKILRFSDSPYSPDYAPSGYLPLLNSEEWLGKKGLTPPIESSLRQTPISRDSTNLNRVKKLENRWKKFMKLKGDYPLIFKMFFLEKSVLFKNITNLLNHPHCLFLKLIAFNVWPVVG